MRPQLYNVGPMRSCEAANTDDLIQSHLSRAVRTSGYICFICTFGCGSRLLRVPTYGSTGAICVFVCLHTQKDLISIEGSASPLHLLSLWHCFCVNNLSRSPQDRFTASSAECWKYRGLKLCFSSSHGATVNKSVYKYKKSISNVKI